MAFFTPKNNFNDIFLKKGIPNQVLNWEVIKIFKSKYKFEAFDRIVNGTFV